ncbi:hypothetical protein [Streptomyces sp. NPDC046332]|uniref:hypothetical protein n=1 Tax=Streptomyces sp. NPDC046332 TaxID=3155133 RepID=UPI0033F40052
MAAAGYGDVTVVVDERDDVFYTRAALRAHSPEQGRVTVHPTPASSSPAALAHDVLYALGKRLAPGPDSPDAWLDSVNAAWLAAAAWAQATGVRHVVVPRAHLLTLRRIDQLLAWRTATGVQLTLLWQREACKLPPVLAQVERRLSGRARFEAILSEPGPIPACPSFPPVPPVASVPPTMTGPAVQKAHAGRSPIWPPQGTRPTGTRQDRRFHLCASAASTAQLIETTSTVEATPETVAALHLLAHPLVAGALSVLAFARAGLGSLRGTRDLDITGAVCTIKIHKAGHRYCSLHAVPDWARPLLAAARAHHRLAPGPDGDSVFAPVMGSEARDLRAHAGRLPRPGQAMPGSVLALKQWHPGRPA